MRASSYGPWQIFSLRFRSGWISYKISFLSVRTWILLSFQNWTVSDFRTSVHRGCERPAWSTSTTVALSSPVSVSLHHASLVSVWLKWRFSRFCSYLHCNFYFSGSLCHHSHSVLQAPRKLCRTTTGSEATCGGSDSNAAKSLATTKLCHVLGNAKIDICQECALDLRLFIISGLSDCVTWFVFLLLLCLGRI